MNESTRLAALDAVEESNDSTSSDKDTLVGSNKEETSKPALVSTETKAVNRSKGIVYLCLVATALAVGISVFFFLSNNETSVMKAEVGSQLLTVFVLCNNSWLTRNDSYALNFHSLSVQRSGN